jgi:hypothetical protein
MICKSTELRHTKRDSLIGAGVMVGGSAILATLGIALRRSGWPVTGEVLTTLSFTASLTLSMPFWVMKGQPWKAQAVIVGGTLAVLVAIGLLASLT